MTDGRGRRLWWVWGIIGAVVLIAAGVGAVLLVTAGNGNGDRGGINSPAPSVTAPVQPAPTAASSPSGQPTPAVTASPTITPSSESPSVTPAPIPPAITAVTPFVSYAGWDASSQSLSISASVPQIVENGGSCVITATKGNATVTATFSATAAASSTDCGSNALSSPELTSGTWSVVVSYSSASASGTSAPNAVEIP